MKCIGYVWVIKSGKECWKPVLEVLKVLKRGKNSGKLLVLLSNNKKKILKENYLKLFINCPNCGDILERNDYKLTCKICGWPENDRTKKSNIFDES